jgi:GDPmannose 4,6-dehydratase
VSKKALVLGANGQDGSYLLEHLLFSGWTVVGVGRQARSLWVVPNERYTYVELDIQNHGALLDFVATLSPDYIFHAAAVHGMAGFSYENVWDSVLAVNTQSVFAILEYLRRKPDCGFCYISSAKVFGDIAGLTVSELSKRQSDCIYSISKNAAYDLIKYYRIRHSVRAVVAWTFNHDSPRRGDDFFIPRVVRTLAQSVLNPSHFESFERLRFWGNWGSASEYMHILVCLANMNVFDDFVFAAPETVWAESFVADLFKSKNLNWKDHIHLLSQPELEISLSLTADMSKLFRASGLKTVKNCYDVADEMLQAMTLSKV